MLTDGFLRCGCDSRRPLLARRKVDLLCHSHQVSERVSAHLLHHPAPMHLDGDFTRPQFRGDLLVEHAGDYEGHDFALACSQTFVAASQFRNQTLLSTPGSIAIESLLNCP